MDIDELVTRLSVAIVRRLRAMGLLNEEGSEIVWTASAGFSFGSIHYWVQHGLEDYYNHGLYMDERALRTTEALIERLELNDILPSGHQSLEGDIRCVSYFRSLCEAYASFYMGVSSATWRAARTIPAGEVASLEVGGSG